MATKLKSKPKAIKKASTVAKSVRLKAKPTKLDSKNSAPRHPPKSEKAARAGAAKKNPPVSSKATRKAGKPLAKVELRRAAVAEKSTPSPEKVRSRHYASALQAYEAGIKLMHAEEYQKAIKCFQELVNEYSEEPEIQERAKVLIQASEKRIHEKTRTVVRSADEHYNIAIAELNRRALDSALQHLQQALKLAPKGDHILYALAAANALQGNRDEALTFLRQSIHHRPENRFFAARDEDFHDLNEDSDFKQLVTPTEK